MREVEYQFTARRFRYASPYAATFTTSIRFAFSRYSGLPVNRHASAHRAASVPHSLMGGRGVEFDHPGGAGSVPEHLGPDGYLSHVASRRSRSPFAAPNARAFTAGHVSELKNNRGWSRRIAGGSDGSAAPAQSANATPAKRTEFFMPPQL